jgi:hypothetical protein
MCALMANMEKKLKNLKLKESDAENSDSDEENGIKPHDDAGESIDVGLIDVDLDDLNENDLKLYRLKMRSPFFTSKVGGKPVIFALYIHLLF